MLLFELAALNQSIPAGFHGMESSSVVLKRDEVLSQSFLCSCQLRSFSPQIRGRDLFSRSKKANKAQQHWH